MNSNEFDESLLEVEVPIAKKFRVQLDFSRKDFSEINRLAEGMGLSSRAEAFRSALTALRWLYAKKLQGCTIVAITPDKRYLEPEFSFLQHLQPQEVPAKESSVASL